MVETDYKFNDQEISYEVTEKGYNIYLGGKLWITQYEPYIPNPKLSYEENAIAQIKEIVGPENVLPETIEEFKEAKIKEMNEMQQTVISAGTDVTLSDGTVEHFTLTEKDQTSIIGLQTMVVAGAEQIPWHNSDKEEHCKYYSNQDMTIICQTAMAYVTYHVTYFRDLRIYINSLEDIDKINAVEYGMNIPKKYQSEVLKTLIAQMNVEVSE